MDSNPSNSGKMWGRTSDNKKLDLWQKLSEEQKMAAWGLTEDDVSNEVGLELLAQIERPPAHYYSTVGGAVVEK